MSHQVLPPDFDDIASGIAVALFLIACLIWGAVISGQL